MLTVGRYRLEDRIGEGAMAEVYRAYDPDIDRTLAVKVMQAEFRSNSDLVSRFLREARAAGALAHPGIVTVHDVGEVGGVPYIAMELLQGRTLAEALAADGPFPAAEVAALGRQLADGLHYAHERGIVHRDVKPSNIWLSADGTSIKILDFGIARRAEADLLRVEVEALRTQIGQVLGTPRYMSPEQALGQPLDRRSDLFSLGAVLYEMVAGRPAFGGSGLAEIALQITGGALPPIIAASPNCSQGLAAIIAKLLEKSPGRRYATAADVAEALSREAKSLELQQTAEHGDSSYRLRLISIATMIVGMVLAASFHLMLERQTMMMQRMATASGTSITAFVAKNAALSVVENAGRHQSAQDWAPLQAFVAAAAEDPSIARLRVVDRQGEVRASSIAGENGSRRPTRTADRSESPRTAVFHRDIVYAGRSFGTVELTLDTTALKSAVADARLTLLLFVLAIFATIMAVTVSISTLLYRPLRILGAAVDSLGRGELSARISHRRTDEFGKLFDRFNAMAAAVERDHQQPAAATPVEAADATIIMRSPEPRKAA